MKRIFVDQVAGERTESESKHCTQYVGSRSTTAIEVGFIGSRVVENYCRIALQWGFGAISSSMKFEVLLFVVVGSRPGFEVSGCV